jgi:hypothetical protein
MRKMPAAFLAVKRRREASGDKSHTESGPISDRVSSRLVPVLDQIERRQCRYGQLRLMRTADLERRHNENQGTLLPLPDRGLRLLQAKALSFLNCDRSLHLHRSMQARASRLLAIDVAQR